MDGFAREKVPNGKLVAAEVQCSDVIKRVKITGDFFMHPESRLADIETSLAGMPTDASEMQMVNSIESVIGKSTQLLGVTAEAIAHVVRSAISNAK